LAKISISLDSDLAIDVMMLVGTSNPQDAVEAIVRDYLAATRRTEALTNDSGDHERFVERRWGAEEG